LTTEAKLFIQEPIKEYRIDLVWSSVNSYENNGNPSPENGGGLRHGKILPFNGAL